jgi:uncharacterized protein YcnI
VLLVAAAAWYAGTAHAAAHIDVLPRQVPAGEAVELTIRVPNERDVPTTGVRVDFPSAVTVYSFAEPPPGWRIRPLEAADGRLRGVVYEGGRIGVGRYADFRLLATPFEEGVTVWQARQRYADGQVKPWTGPPETPGGAAAPESGPTDPGPAPAVEVVPPGQADAGVAAAGDGGSGAGVWLGVVAIGIAALAALGVGALWSTRPARLPGDDGERR